MFEFLLTFFYLTICIIVIYKGKFFILNGFSKELVVFAFLIKFVAASALTLLYTYYYPRETADIFRFFNDAKHIYQSLFVNPIHYIKLISGYDLENPELQVYIKEIINWSRIMDEHIFNDNRTLIRFNAIVMLFSFGNFWVHNVFSAFLSFIGLVGLYKFIKYHFKKDGFLLFIIVFGIPSLIFWTSGVLKESVLMFSMGIFLYSSQRVFQNFDLKHFIILLLSFWLLALIKYYVLISLIPGLIAYLWHIKSSKIQVYKKYILSYLFFLCLLVINIYSESSIINIISIKQNDFINFAQELGDVGSYIELTRLSPNLYSFIKVLPEAFINSFLRPFPTDINSVMAIIPFAENMLIILIGFLIIKFPKKIEYIDFNFVFFSASFIIVLFLLSGYTTPVLGALVRYKVPALPFLYCVLIYFIDTDCLCNKRFF